MRCHRASGGRSPTPRLGRGAINRARPVRTPSTSSSHTGRLVVVAVDQHDPAAPVDRVALLGPVEQPGGHRVVESMIDASTSRLTVLGPGLRAAFDRGRRRGHVAGLASRGRGGFDGRVRAALLIPPHRDSRRDQPSYVSRAATPGKRDRRSFTAAGDWTGWSRLAFGRGGPACGVSS